MLSGLSWDSLGSRGDLWALLGCSAAIYHVADVVAVTVAAVVVTFTLASSLWALLVLSGLSWNSLGSRGDLWALLGCSAAIFEPSCRAS